MSSQTDGLFEFRTFSSAGLVIADDLTAAVMAEIGIVKIVPRANLMGHELAGTWSLVGDQLTLTYSEKDLRELVEKLLAAEIDLSEMSDAEIEEVIDEFMADAYPEGPVSIMTINSITDTELITTDEDGKKNVLTRKN